MPVTTGEIVYTVGHSNRSLEELLAILAPHRIATLVDVRRTPWSKRHPQFCKPALERLFEGLPVHYKHVEALGGRRPSDPDSPNDALPEAVRGYADHVATNEFRTALMETLTLNGPIVYMCAEAVPSACHRSILSDELVRLDFRVFHLLESGREAEHRLDPRAVDEGSRLIYPSRSVTQMTLPLE